MRGKEVGRVSVIKFLKACLRRQGRKERGPQLKGYMVLRKWKTQEYIQMYLAQSLKKRMLMNRIRSLRSLEWRWSRG